MKKTKHIKIGALLLVVIMMLQVLGASGIAMVASAATSDAKNVAISIPSGKQAVYTAKLDVASGKTANVKFGTNELFSVASSLMRVCGSQINGSFSAGVYTVKAYINPAQTLVLVEVTFPDGGVVRRGSYSITEGSAVTIGGSATPSDVSVTYEDITIADYKLVTTEPADSTFSSSKIYNIITSFTDPKTDRLFNFTATRRFGSSGTMIVEYRAKGTEEWSSVDAVKVEEPTNVVDEDYFKAHITGLTPGTEYEYRVGKKDSSVSQIYTFTTAPEYIDELSFIAIGDTQGYMWGNWTEGGTEKIGHYQYTHAALKEALKHVPNPAFILNTGDIVDSGYQAYQWKRYFKALGSSATQYAHFAAIGNHDTRNAANVQTNDNLNNYFSFYLNHPSVAENALDMDPEVIDKLSDSAKVLVNNFDETIYSYSYGDAHFIVLNSGTFVNTGNYTYPDDEHFFNAQRAWLESDLEANKDAKWTIVLIHEPSYHRSGANNQDRTYLTDVFEGYGVDLIIQGHSHIFTRSYPMKDGKIVTKSSPDLITKGTGTVYVTIGATTTGHDAIGTSTVEAMQTVISHTGTQPAYTTVTIKGTDLVLTTRQLDGLVLDTFTIRGTEDFAEDRPVVEETTEAPTTEAPTTEAPTTEAPATEAPTTEAPTTEAPSTEAEVTTAPYTDPVEEPAGGCGSSIGVAGLALVSAIGACTVFVAKKRD